MDCSCKVRFAKNDWLGKMSSLKASLGLSLVTILLLSTALFGHPIALLNFITLSTGGLGAPKWQLGLVAAIMISSLVFIPFPGDNVYRYYRIPIFSAFSLTLSVLFVGIYADCQRHEAIRVFQPDHVLQHSFFRSIREVPEEYQFFLHAAALKNCTFYGWSYSKMQFYVVPPRAEANVFPWEWNNLCRLERAHRG